MAEINLDIDALRDALKHAEGMVAYYGKADEKAAQNRALAAAGLKPLHDEREMSWDVEQGRKFRRHAEALRAVLTQFGADQAEAA